MDQMHDSQTKKLKVNQSLPITTDFPFFNQLPQDLKLVILDRLPISDQLRFALVSQDCKALINCNKK